MQQSPLLGVVSGGRSDDAKSWDARALFEVGVLIARWLEVNPPPVGAVFYQPLEGWARRLRDRGQARLEALGERRLRVM